MKVTELARALGPRLDQHIIGIRPERKLHESMISEDDAPSTVELPDRYMILPSFAHWAAREPVMKLPSEPIAVRQTSGYASNINDRWLTPEVLRKMIETLGDASV